MSVNIYNTRTKKKELFVPLSHRQVSMYVCGVTVYDYCHLGHARSALVFDIIKRYFEFKGYQVKFIRNFTDVDDKILQRAQRENVSWNKVTEQYINAFHEDMAHLGVSTPTAEPRATHHIPDIIEMVTALVEKGYAYVVEGDVYFEVKKFQAYGQLSGRNLEELLAGARVEIDPRKKNPLDFALWKMAKAGEPGWESPWGKGRPGWHIECSAMSIKHLGSTFDIHGGGKDLIFPHHENEVAQSCAYTGKEFARYWIHNGFVTIDEEKMSKSVGNFFTIREIFANSPYSERITGECLRYYLLSTHYRSDLNFSHRSLPEGYSALNNFYDLIKRLTELENNPRTSVDEDLYSQMENLSRDFSEAMNEDFNTPRVLAALHEFRGVTNKLLKKGISDEAKGQALNVLYKFGSVLGIFQIPIDAWLFKIKKVEGGDYSEKSIPGKVKIKKTESVERDFIEEQIRLRKEARKNKDFASADQIRKALAEKGIILEDRPDGTTRWKR